ncbi:MAG: type I-E CRISPR-associated protein Cse2/CasB [Pseudomonadota bacterium]
MSTPRYEEQAKAASKWWSKLGPQTNPETGHTMAGDRATLARLRRADSLLDAASEPATIDLFLTLGFDRRWAQRDLPRAALIAAVLANVRDNDSRQWIANAIGQPRGGEDTTALITPLRFKRIVAARTPGDLFIQFRRVVAIMDRTANVKDLAKQLLAFTDPDEATAERARVMFAFAYHGADAFAPYQDDETTSPSANT